jgi:hypothetical protein
MPGLGKIQDAESPVAKRHAIPIIFILVERAAIVWPTMREPGQRGIKLRT